MLGRQFQVANAHGLRVLEKFNATHQVKSVRTLVRNFATEKEAEVPKELSFEEYWWQRAKKIHWFNEPTVLFQKNENNGLCQWFPDGTTNLSYNCLDAHLETNGGEWALVYDSEATQISGFYTYKQLHRRVNRFAGVLKNLNVQVGDKVILYMPDIPQAAKANLALWRIGGISVPIHSAYGEKQLIKAINDLNPTLIITASCYVEGEDVKPLKKIVDNARAASNFPQTKTLLIQRKFRPETESINKEIDFEFDEEVEKINGTVDPVVLPSNHPSYIYWHRQQNVSNEYFLRDTGGLAVGVRAGLKDNYSVKKRETIMLSSHLAYDIGLNYMLVAPLLCGMKTVINEEFYKDNKSYWGLVNKYSVNFLIGHANKINSLARDANKEFPGKDVQLDSLKSVTFYNGSLENEAEIDMFNKHITGSKFHNTCYLSSLGTFVLGGANPKVSAAGMESKPLNRIDLYCEEISGQLDDKRRPLFSKSPFYPAAYNGFILSKQDGVDHSNFINKDGDWILPYLGYFDQSGNVMISYPKRIKNTEGKTIDLEKISELVREFSGVKYAHVFSRPEKTKLNEACAILHCPEETNRTELLKLINERIESELGDHNELGDIFIIKQMHNRFDWNVASQIIKTKGSRIVSNMEHDYGELLTQIPREEKAPEKQGGSAILQKGLSKQANVENPDTHSAEYKYINKNLANLAQLMPYQIFTKNNQIKFAQPQDLYQSSKNC